MTKPLTVTREVHFRNARRGRRVITTGPEPVNPSPGRVPRVSRLMALAIHMEDLVRRGEVADYADLARLAHVSRARVTQIMNLLHLAPDIQTEILTLPRVAGDRDGVGEKAVRPIAAVPDWRKQRRLWADVRAGASKSSH